MPMPPSMAGFYGVSKFGGYADWQFSERFGVEVGAQAVQQISIAPRAGGPAQRYQWKPIATPYFKLSNKVKIGIPVGEILYDVIRNR